MDCWTEEGGTPSRLLSLSSSLIALPVSLSLSPTCLSGEKDVRVSLDQFHVDPCLQAKDALHDLASLG